MSESDEAEAEAKPQAPAAAKTEEVQHSRIYNALNVKPLWAETEEDKKKREEGTYVRGVGSGAAMRSAAGCGLLCNSATNSDVDSSIVIDDSVEGEDDLAAADERIEVLRKQVCLYMSCSPIMLTRHRLSKAWLHSTLSCRAARQRMLRRRASPPRSSFDPRSNRNQIHLRCHLRQATATQAQTAAADSVCMRSLFAAYEGLTRAGASLNFDADFMAELERRRAERAAEEKARAEQLRAAHQAASEKERAEQQKILDALAAEKAAEKEKEDRRKVGSIICM